MHCICHLNKTNRAIGSDPDTRAMSSGREGAIVPYQLIIALKQDKSADISLKAGPMSETLADNGVLVWQMTQHNYYRRTL